MLFWKKNQSCIQRFFDGLFGGFSVDFPHQYQ
jgi:hypothetical protein